MGNWYTCMLLSTYGANKQSQRAVYQGTCAHAEDYEYVLDWRLVLNITSTSLPGTHSSRTKEPKRSTRFTSGCFSSISFRYPLSDSSTNFLIEVSYPHIHNRHPQDHAWHAPGLSLLVLANILLLLPFPLLQP